MAKKKNHTPAPAETTPEAPGPSPSVAQPRTFLVRVKLTAGSTDRRAESLEAAKALARDILAHGLEDKLPGTEITVIYGRNQIQRVEITPQ